MRYNTVLSAVPTFHNLPRDIRDQIYDLAIPRGKWRSGDEGFDAGNFAAGVGDPSGFYYPLSKEVAILRVSRSMRMEALPMAYRRTAFSLYDIDDAIKLLVAVGRLGRQNIEWLAFTWESRADAEHQWDQEPGPGDLFSTLPVLHATRCVQLLRQCSRLRTLRLSFDSDLIVDMSPEDYEADPGIRELCSLRGIRKVDIRDLMDEPLDQCGLVRWLVERMESPKEKEVEVDVLEEDFLIQASDLNILDQDEGHSSQQ